VNSGLQRSLAGFLQPALGERGTQLIVGKYSLQRENKFEPDDAKPQDVCAQP